MNILAVIDDVPKVYAHAEIKRPCCQCRLHRDGAFDGVLDGWEFGEKTVARVFNDPPGVFDDQWINDLGPGGLPGGNRAIGITLHQARIARDVGRQNRR